jgi:hypothetical protein
MPTIAMVQGLEILIYPADHLPPHFHVRGGDIRMRIEIETGAIMSERGDVTPRHRRMLREWTDRNREGLMQNWISIRAGSGRRPLS